MSGKYDELDAEIVKEIASGRNTLHEIMVTSIASAEGVNYLRLLDRRLQSLRKRGAIRFSGGKWQIVS